MILNFLVDKVKGKRNSIIDSSTYFNHKSRLSYGLDMYYKIFWLINIFCCFTVILICKLTLCVYASVTVDRTNFHTFKNIPAYLSNR